LAALQTVNSAVQALGTSAQSFFTGSTWQQLTATSSDSAISVTADATATAANLNVKVIQRATAAQVSFAAPHALTDLIADAGGSLSLGFPDGSTTSVATGDGSFKTILANLAALKDASGNPLVNASSINLGGGTYQLLLTAGSTGGGPNPISLSGANLNLGLANPTPGQDAKIDLGAGVVVTSRSNTFTDLLPGVDLTLNATASGTTVSQVAVTADPASRSNGIKALVQQLNSVLSSISASTSYGDPANAAAGSASAGSGLLAGDSVVNSFAQKLINTIYTASGGVLNNVGVTIDRYGQFQFDASKFADAYAKDPTGVQDAITGPTGFAARLAKASSEISGTVGLQTDGTILASDGQLTQMIKQQRGTISGYSDQIRSWDDRLAAKRASLGVLYTHLETTLSKLSAQQSWLSSALEGLSSSSSSKS
jgi:flagellar hook-associated protein 2